MQTLAVATGGTRGDEITTTPDGRVCSASRSRSTCSARSSPRASLAVEPARRRGRGAAAGQHQRHASTRTCWPTTPPIPARSSTRTTTCWQAIPRASCPSSSVMYDATHPHRRAQLRRARRRPLRAACAHRPAQQRGRSTWPRNTTRPSRPPRTSRRSSTCSSVSPAAITRPEPCPFHVTITNTSTHDCCCRWSCT